MFIACNNREKKMILSGTISNESGRRAPDEVSKSLFIDLFDQIRKTWKMKVLSWRKSNIEEAMMMKDRRRKKKYRGHCRAE